MHCPISTTTFIEYSGLYIYIYTFQDKFGFILDNLRCPNCFCDFWAFIIRLAGRDPEDRSLICFCVDQCITPRKCLYCGTTQANLLVMISSSSRFLHTNTLTTSHGYFKLRSPLEKGTEVIKVHPPTHFFLQDVHVCFSKFFPYNFQPISFVRCKIL